MIVKSFYDGNCLSVYSVRDVRLETVFQPVVSGMSV